MEEVKTKVNTKPFGKSGTLIVSNVVNEEYLAELVGVEGYAAYNKMRKSDPQVKKIVAAIVNPIKAANWYIDPLTNEKVDLEQAALMDQIIFKDAKFEQRLGEFLTCLFHGFSMFEPIHTNKISKDLGPYTTIANLAFRAQASITEWIRNEVTGELEQVRQQQSGDLKVDAYIPAENLLIFYNEKEGDDNGSSILRPLYGPYKRKLLTETLKMIGIERFSIPSPMVGVPEGISVNDEEYKAAIRVISAFTSAENSYLTYPIGWEMDLKPNSGFDPMKLEDSIKREDEKMAGAILATFLELGTGGNSGAYALGDNLAKFFTQVIDSFAKVIKEELNTTLIPQMMRFNYGEYEGTGPQLEYSGITEQAGKEFMEIVTGYVKDGVITKDEGLEDFVRKTHNLPKKDEGTAIDNQEGNNDSTNTNGEADSTSSTDDSSNDDEGADVTLSETVKLAANIQAQISKESKEVEEIMNKNLSEIGKKYVVDMTTQYKQLPENSKLDAAGKVKIGGTAKYKRQLKGVFNSVARRAMEQVRSEVPTKQALKLSENEKFSKELDEYGTIKMAKDDLTGLPPHIKKLINLQANRIVDSQVQTMTDRVVFTYGQNIPRTNDYAVIEQKMNGSAQDFATGNTVTTASVNAASTITNQTRSEFLFEKEVLEEIYAFRFTNSDPKSAICQLLTGSVFAKDDQEFLSYSPPLHHNCKSYLVPVLQTAKTKPAIEPLPPIDEKARKSINLGTGKTLWQQYVEKLVTLNGEF